MFMTFILSFGEVIEWIIYTGYTAFEEKIKNLRIEQQQRFYRCVQTYFYFIVNVFDNFFYNICNPYLKLWNGDRLRAGNND